MCNKEDVVKELIPLLIKRINDLDSETAIGFLRSFIKQIDDSNLIEEKYEVENGLLGLMRDIYVQLICITKDFRKMSAMFGVSQTCYLWKDSMHFKWLLQRMPFILTHPKSLNNIFFNFHDGCVKSLQGKAFGVCNMLVKTGVWRFTIKRWDVGEDLEIGIASCDRKHPFGDIFNEKAVAAYHKSGRCRQNGISLGNSAFYKDNILSLEVDMKKHTLHFFKNNIWVQPVSYINIPPQIRFFIMFQSASDSIFFLSLKELPFSSVSSFDQSDQPEMAVLAQEVSSPFAIANTMVITQTATTTSVATNSPLFSLVTGGTGCGTRSGSRLVEWNYTDTLIDR